MHAVWPTSCQGCQTLEWWCGLCHYQLPPKDQYTTTNVPLPAFQKKSLSVWLFFFFFFSPRRADEEALAKKIKKAQFLRLENAYCLGIRKDTLIILANYIPVRGKYIYMFNIQLISQNSFDQIDMLFILKCCARISSLDTLMCEVMNLFSSLLQNAFHFSLQI